MKQVKYFARLTKLAAAAVLWAAGYSAAADTITMNLGDVIHGGFPSGDQSSSPYLVAVFQDISGGVQLTLTAPGLGFHGSGNYEHVLNGWEFNVNSTYANTLTFGLQSQTGTFTDPTISQAAYGSQAGNPAGIPDAAHNKFDISMKFAESDAVPPTSEFGNGDKLILLITSSVSGLSAAAFNLQDPSSLLYYSAAAIDDANAGTWVAATNSTTTVPDAANSAGLLGLAFLGMGGLRRKFRRV